MQSVSIYQARRWAKIAAVGVAALSLLLAAACGGAPAPVVVGSREATTSKNPPRSSIPASAPAPNGGRSAQAFTLLDDSRAILSDYQGQVVVLDFWATYCPPCRAEAPHLNALQQRFGERGLRVIGLNVGGDGDRPKVSDFVRQLNLKYTFGYPDPEMINFYMGSDDRIPQTLVFDRSGRLVKHFVNYDDEVKAELERTIEKAVMSTED